MQTTVQCAKCDKRYSIDSKFAGKRVKCKNCGNRIAIPTAGAAADDPMADWDDEDEGDFGPPPTFELPEDALPPVPAAAAVAEPAKAANAAYVDAISELSVEAAPKAPRLPLRERVDAWLPWRAGWIYVVGFLAAAVMPWVWMALHRLPWRSALRDSVMELVAWGVFYFVALRLALLGAVGARVAKFEPPPDLFRRLRAALLIPLILGVAIWLPLTHPQEGGHAYKVINGRLTLVPTIIWSAEPNLDLSAYTHLKRIIAEAALGVCVVTAFLAFRFFLRLRWKKALVSFPVMAAFYGVGLTAVFGAGWGVLKLMEYFLKVSAST